MFSRTDRRTGPYPDTGIKCFKLRRVEVYRTLTIIRKEGTVAENPARPSQRLSLHGPEDSADSCPVRIGAEASRSGRKEEEEEKKEEEEVKGRRSGSS